MEKVLDDRAKLYGAKNYQELIINQNIIIILWELKFLRLKYDILTRYSRGRPAQITDLIILRQLFKLKYKLKIPKTRMEYDKETKKDKITDVNPEKFVNTVKNYLSRRYFINLSIDNIKDWIKKEIKEQKGGSQDLYIENEYISDKNIIYPNKKELIKLGYTPKVIIYNDYKPYVYIPETFKSYSIMNYCNNRNKKESKKPSN